MPSADALVLRTVDFSESSRIVTLYTRQFGKVEALAKGARRLKSSFESSLDILAQNSVVFIQKRGDVLDLLTESKLLRRFRVHSANLAGTLGGCYVAELINSFTAPGDPMPPLYDWTVKALHQLESGMLVMRTLTRYEGRLLQLLGHYPTLGNCAECGEVISREPGKNIIFGMLDGGVLCATCRSAVKSSAHRVVVKPETLDIWEALTTPLDRSEQWKRLKISPETQGEIRRFANQYICTLLGWRPRLHGWWNVITKYDKHAST